LKPLLKLLLAYPRIRNRRIEVLHQDFLRQKREITDSEVGQIFFPDPMAAVILPVKCGMRPNMG
jgi:hypothetical protein